MSKNKKLRWEPSRRWIRVRHHEETIADSTNTLLVWEGGHRLNYYFPAEAVRTDLLQATGRNGGDRIYYHVNVNGETVENGAYRRTDPALEDEVKERIAFRWDKMDHIFEEEEEVFLHPRDPYIRVDVIPSSRHVRIEIEGVTVAESQRPYLLYETHLPTRYYLPPEDVNMNYLEATDSHTICPYKGTASYWSVKVGDNRYKDLVWSYPEPIAEAPKLAGLLSFYNEKVDIYVDGELEEKPKTGWS